MLDINGLKVYGISELQCYLGCPQQWGYEYGEGLQSKSYGGVPRPVGTAVHEGVAALYAGSNNWIGAGLENYDEAVKRWMASYAEGSKERRQMEGGRMQVEAILTDYPWAAKDFDKVEAIEEMAIINMGDGRGYMCKWDRSLKWGENRTFLHDTKTTGEDIAMVCKAHRQRMQYKAYSYAWRIAKGDRIEGFVMDFIHKPKVNWKKNGEFSSMRPMESKHYHREPFIVRERDYDYFPVWFHRVCRSIESDAETNFYPTNSDTCHKWGGFCEFFDLCRSGKMSLALKEISFKRGDNEHQRQYLHAPIYGGD